MTITLDNTYIDGQIKFLEAVGFDTIFDSENYDIMLDFVWQDYAAYEVFCFGQDLVGLDPVREYCKSRLSDFILFVCEKYCSLDFIFDYEKKSTSQKQAEICLVLEKENFKYMFEVKNFFKSDSELFEALHDDEFSLKLKEYLFSHRFLDD